MTTKHTAIDSKGLTHKRSSKDRVYTHAIVTYFADGDTKVSWAGSLTLAQKQARSPYSAAVSTEIVPATIVP
jgi:hypothetical protein